MINYKIIIYFKRLLVTQSKWFTDVQQAAENFSL